MMREEKVLAIALVLWAMMVLAICALCIHSSNNRNEKMLNDTKQQKEELQNEITEIEEEETIETIYPEEIDCKTEMKEGDISVRVTMELYNPLGEWIEITEENAEYQIKNGGRVIICK